VLERAFNICFGFTEGEVAALMEKAGFGHTMAEVRAYYDGYDFGGVEIYNPWSILHFLASETKQLEAHWVGTSSNLLIKELLQTHALRIQEEMRTLLEGGVVEKHVDTNVIFPELKNDPDTLWSLLVFSGYLKASRPPGPIVVGKPVPPYRLSIPNIEVASVYRSSFSSWMKKALVSQNGELDTLLKKLLEGESEKFEAQLQRFALTLPSYQDLTGAEPETFYHGLMIGLLASLEPDYEVRSNRESGDGRPDVLIKPRYPGKPGVVLEVKMARQGQKTLEAAVCEGLKQLATHDYAAELRAAGVQKIRQMVVGFDGKRVMVLPKGAPNPKARRSTTRARRSKKR
jgi:hypothetical protein